MNILSSYKFQVKSHKKPIIVFFSIIAALYILDIVSSIFESVVSDSVTINIGGQEIALFIFIFVMGISIFSENFHMLIQNGISRKSMFIGRLATVFSVSAVCSVISMALLKLFGLFASICGGDFTSEALLRHLYTDYFAGAGFIGGLFTDLLLIFSLCVALTSIGYFTATLMYRLPKYGKFIFWGGLWALCMIVLPVLEYWLFDGAILKAMFDFVMFATGIESGNPFVMTASCGVVFAVFSAATWFILFKLPVKK